MKQCAEANCTTPARTLGMCGRHYMIELRTRHRKAHAEAEQAAREAEQSGLCQHLDCSRPSRYRFTLPYPITRQENACAGHAEHLLGSFLPGVTVEGI